MSSWTTKAAICSVSTFRVRRRYTEQPENHATRAGKETPYAAAIVGTTVAEAPLPELSLLPEPPLFAEPLLSAEPSVLSELPEPSLLSETPLVVRAGSMIVAYSAGLKRS